MTNPMPNDSMIPETRRDEVERLREVIRFTVADASFHLQKHRPHVLEALKQALSATPDARLDVAGWRPIETAPHACHVLATRFDEAACEWVVAVVLSPPSHPFTHWMPLPEAPRHV